DLKKKAGESGEAPKSSSPLAAAAGLGESRDEDRTLPAHSARRLSPVCRVVSNGPALVFGLPTAGPSRSKRRRNRTRTAALTRSLLRRPDALDRKMEERA